MSIRVPKIVIRHGLLQWNPGPPEDYSREKITDEYEIDFPILQQYKIKTSIYNDYKSNKEYLESIEINSIVELTRKAYREYPGKLFRILPNVYNDKERDYYRTVEKQLIVYDIKLDHKDFSNA